MTILLHLAAFERVKNALPHPVQPLQSHKLGFRLSDSALQKEKGPPEGDP
jgi:hypothetical protein